MGALASSLARSNWRRPSGAAVKRGAWNALGFGGLVFFAAFAGLLCVYLPWILVVGLSLTLVFPVVAWNWPWVGVGVCALVVLVAPDVKMADVATVGTMTILGAKMLGDKARIWPPRQLFRPYLILMGLVLLSLVLALTLFRNQIPFLYRDARAFVYWLWFPILFWLVGRDDAGMLKLGRLIMLIGGAISLIALLQWSTGVQIIATGRVGALDTAGGAQGDQTRVQMQGFVFVLFCVVWAFLSLVHGRRGWWLLGPVILLLLAALYVNFGRGLWFWTGAAVLLSVLFVGQRRAVYMLSLLAISVSLSVGGLALFKPQVLDTMVTRFASVRDEGGSRTSLGWRKLENEDALGRVARSPVVGVGLGGEYRRWISEIRLFEDHTRYVHNSYIFVALKLGVPALLALLALLALSWRKGRAAIRSCADDRKPLLIAAVATLPAVLGLSVTQPELANAYGAIFFCCLLVILGSDAAEPRTPSDARPKRGLSPTARYPRRWA